MNIYSYKNKGVAGNIWKMVLMYITNKRTYMTFLTIFLLLMPNTTAQTIGFVTSLGMILEVFLEVPSGYLSDKLGHKNALIIAKLSLFLSTLCYVLATSILYFYIGAVFFAIGLSMLSGTSSVFMKETLDYLGKGNDYSKISGKVRSFGFFIPVIFIVLLPILAENSYRLAFLVALFIDFIGLVTVLSLTSVPKEQHIEEFNVSKSKSVLRQYLDIGWLPVVIFSGAIFSILLSGTVGFKNPFQESIGFSLTMLGILWGISRLGISGLLLFNDWFKKNLTLKSIIVLQGIVYSIVLIGVGVVDNKWVIGVLFIIGTMTMWGLNAAKSHFYLEYIGYSNYKASFLSINTFFQKIIASSLTLLMGYLVLTKSYQYSFIFFGVLALLVTVFGIFFVKEKQKS